MKGSTALLSLAPLVAAAFLFVPRLPVTPVGTVFARSDYLDDIKSPMRERLAEQTPEAREVAFSLDDEREGGVKITITSVIEPVTHALYFKGISCEVTRNARYHFTSAAFSDPVNHGSLTHPVFGAVIGVVYDWTTPAGWYRAHTALFSVKADGTVRELGP
jgi:hypothetical protein